ncbi:hypothetical protein V8E55_008051 [Tylopilus felleus]
MVVITARASSTPTRPFGGRGGGHDGGVGQEQPLVTYIATSQEPRSWYASTDIPGLKTRGLTPASKAHQLPHAPALLQWMFSNPKHRTVGWDSGRRDAGGVHLLDDDQGQTSRSLVGKRQDSIEAIDIAASGKVKVKYALKGLSGHLQQVYNDLEEEGKVARKVAWGEWRI